VDWSILYTKPGEEKRAQVNLESIGLTVYFPKLAVETSKPEIFTISDQPLFPRYVFIARDELVYPKTLHKLRNVRGVSRVVSFNGVPAKISNKSLTIVKTFERESRQSPLPKFTRGQMLRFSYGAYKNIEAIFLENSCNGRVALLFKMLENETRIVVSNSVVSKE